MTVVAPERLFLFTYGTLRKTEPRHKDWLGDSVIEDLGLATIPRTKLYYPTNHNEFPVLVWTARSADQAVGEVFEVIDGDQVAELLEMEINAGYRVEETEAELENGLPIMVAVCTWEWEFGDEVPGNDWLSPERLRFW